MDMLVGCIRFLYFSICCLIVECSKCGRVMSSGDINTVPWPVGAFKEVKLL